jgi:hypothetical protein
MAGGTQIAAHSIAWIQSGAYTVQYRCRRQSSIPHSMRKMPVPIYFSNRLRIADVCPSIHFIADDFLRFAPKPACAFAAFQ